MAVAVQPVPKNTSPSQRGVIQALVSLITVVSALIMEPNVTRAAGLSKPPKTSRFSSFLPGNGKTSLKWYQRLFTVNGWKFNLKVSSEQWKSRITVVYAFASKTWTSLGVFRYVAVVAIVLLLAYSAYLLWQPKTSSLKSHVGGTANGTAVAPKASPSKPAKPYTKSPKKTSGLLGRRKPPSKPASGTRYDANAAYSSPEQASTTIIQDIRNAGLKVVRGDIKTLLEVAFSTGKPIDDKKMAVGSSWPFY